MDTHDVPHVQAGDNRQTRESRERAFQLVERAARSEGDLNATAEAAIRRLSLQRQDYNPVHRAVDWAVYWGIGGYLFRWGHPLVTFLALALLATAVRIARASSSRRRFHERAFGVLADLRRSLTAPFRFGKGVSWRAQLESIVQKSVFVVLLAAIANRWPPLSDLLKGVLP
jgi:hypothetical protein